MGRTIALGPADGGIVEQQAPVVDETERAEQRMKLVLSDPALTEAIAGGGAFGGAYSPAVAQNMLDPNHDEAIADARRLVEMVAVGDRMWLLRLPIVNCVVVETDQGVVLIDSGMAPAGPAILDGIRSVTDAPLHTVIYTHAHIDHCLGTWALTEAGPGGGSPDVVAHANAPRRFDRYVRLRGSVSRYLSQPLSSFPDGPDSWVPPTRTFRDELDLTVGGELFHLVHRRGETDDQLYVSIPGRRAVASADYYQGFLPNAGNGKRVQRYVEEWAEALREMVALAPDHLLPAHGESISDSAVIAERLTVHAEALESIVDQTLAGLNARRRQDEVADAVQLPDRLAEHAVLNEQYVSPADISRMVIKQYCGWWDDIPSHWSPARFDQQAVAICELAGGAPLVIERARALVETDPAMACHLADWAYYADPSDLEAAEAVIEIYSARIVRARPNTQEALMYLDHMTDVKQAMEAADG